MFSSLELVTKFAEAARDAAGDRPGRKAQRGSDHGVALVAAEEPVEDVAAVVRHRQHRLLHRQRLVQPVEAVVDARLERLRIGGLARTGADPVDAEPARQLRDPGPYRLVVAEVAEPLVGAR